MLTVMVNGFAQRARVRLQERRETTVFVRAFTTTSANLLAKIAKESHFYILEIRIFKAPISILAF
jgi:hypothetical protein